MAVTYFDSDETGAPQFTTSGSGASYTTTIIDIMDAVLINGFNGKPGFGWTKEMSSSVTNSDRTVYKNKSAHANDMYLLVESSLQYSEIRFQIADTVTTPESYQGYSHVASLFPSSGYKWKAMGDERTLIFFIYNAYLLQTNYSNFERYNPYVIYIGDFEQFNSANSKCWGLLASRMIPGTFETATNAQTRSHAFTHQILYNKPSEKIIRPITQVPEEEWSEEACYAQLDSLFSTTEETNTPYNYTSSVSEFEQRAHLKAPWFVMINMRHVYQLRGVFNILPWLNHADEDNKANMLKPLTIDGISYIATKQYTEDSKYTGMSLYIQTSGDW
ncbi:hypothetical protein ACH42_17045 [Endozoicomonas sp. (ex Bugula neritina AB1)]|nr:hypothetical protein ACH42_17045 [Endozoicomonas sp. (ex Bugula neritina AB1)]